MPTDKRWIQWLALAAALVLLDASLTFQNVWPTPAIRWSGALSVELAAFILFAVGTRPHWGSLSRRMLRWFSVVWLFLAISHYAEVTAPALYGRDINLYWDLRFVPSVVALLARPARLWLVALAAVLVVLLLGIGYAIIRWAAGQIAAAIADTGKRRALSAIASAIIVLWPVGLLLGTSVVSNPVTWTYARQARLMAASLIASRGLPASPPMNSNLSIVHGADVFVVFVESYGAVSYDRPEFAAGLSAVRANFDAVIRATGRTVVSAYVESPTFGGSSWLAHISLLTGVEVRDHDTNARLMTQSRSTLVTLFKRHGYRTIALMPGTWQTWPEGAFYGFDEIYGGARLDYHGPEFGWWDIPDQFAFAKLDALEVNRAPRAPLFVVFPMISSHIPFTPRPPYQPVWARLLTDEPFDRPDVTRSLDQQPNWLNLGPSYVDALSYCYQSISGYLRTHADRDIVMIVLGDHQPAAAVTGQGAPWDVPVHVIATRRQALDRLLAHGFRSGMTPERPTAGRMNALGAILLDAFGGREATASETP